MLNKIKGNVIRNGALLLCLLSVLGAIAVMALDAAANEQIIPTQNATEFAGGDGTEGNPYQVSTPEQLNNVRNHLGAYFIQTADIDLTEETAEGGAFYNNGKGWSPIGANDSTAFTGSYDGGGCRIIGLKSKQSGSGIQYTGLFGHNKGIIRNVGMESSAVSAPTSSYNAYAGGIAGSNGSSISNCYNTGEVSSSSSSRTAYAGGIAGRNGGSISNCYNTGEVSGRYAGGIAGYNDGGSIENCYNTGAVSGSTAGGIAGRNDDGSIENCYNIGAVSASTSSSSSTAYAGGIAGRNDDGNIENCYYYDVPNLKTEGGTPLGLEALKQQASYIGFDFDTVWEFNTEQTYPFPILRGMALPEQEEENYFDFAGGNGTVYNPYRIENMLHLNHVHDYLDACFIQTADIDLTAATSKDGIFYNDGSGWVPIGEGAEVAFTGNYDGGGYRIIGLKSSQSGSGRTHAGLFRHNSGVIQNLGMEDGSVSSEDYAGGIAGYNDGTIVNCYNTGTVSGRHAGGIVGSNDGGSISNCYNTGEVSGSTAGGIAGSNSGSISNCYNTGAVSASTSSSYSSAYAGGIAGGNDDGSIENCYYYDASNLDAEGGHTAYLRGFKTASELCRL